MQYALQKNSSRLFLSHGNVGRPEGQITLLMTQYPKNLVQTMLRYLYTGIMEKPQETEFKLFEQLLDEYGLMPRYTSESATLVKHSESQKQGTEEMVDKTFEELVKQIKQEPECDDISHTDNVDQITDHQADDTAMTINDCESQEKDLNDVDSGENSENDEWSVTICDPKDRSVGKSGHHSHYFLLSQHHLSPVLVIHNH